MPMKRLLTTSCTDASFNIAAFLLRVIFGTLIFINHGLPKIQTFSQRQSSFYDPFGIGHQASLLLIIFAEVFCAIFVVIGLFTRLAVIPLVIAMAVVVFMNQKGQPLSKIELPIVFMGAFLAILFMGSGKYSVDGAMGK
jgi:putative oxidoreductase